MLLDNKSQRKVGDVIAQKLSAENAELTILSSMFSIYGFAKLNKQLSKIQQLRLAIPESSNNGMSELVGTRSDRKFRNGLNMARVAKACAAWLEKKAEIRTVAISVLQKLIHVKSGDQTTRHMKTNNSILPPSPIMEVRFAHGQSGLKLHGGES